MIALASHTQPPWFYHDRSRIPLSASFSKRCARRSAHTRRGYKRHQDRHRGAQLLRTFEPRATGVGVNERNRSGSLEPNSRFRSRLALGTPWASKTQPHETILCHPSCCLSQHPALKKPRQKRQGAGLSLDWNHKSPAVSPGGRVSCELVCDGSWSATAPWRRCKVRCTRLPCCRHPATRRRRESSQRGGSRTPEHPSDAASGTA